MDPTSAPLRRTTTGIISNRRPVSGTPASTSGSTTPSLHVDATARLSLLATAKREAAKRGLYARFFRGPVLGPDDSPSPSHSVPSSSATSTPVPEHVEDTVGETKRSKKRKSEDRTETKEERRERKRVKKERKAARAAKRAEKALTGDQVKEKKHRKARKRRDETLSEANGTSIKVRKRNRKSVTGSAREDLEQVKSTRKTLEEQFASTNNGQQDTPRNMDTTDVVVTTKKKGKRKDTPS